MSRTLSPPAAPRLPDHALQRLVAGLSRWLQARRSRARQRRELASLDGLAQQELNDLGIGRGDLARLAADLGRDTQAS